MRPNLLWILKQVLGEDEKGVRYKNGKTPDLTDFNLHEIYEIKKNNAREISKDLTDLDVQLSTLNQRDYRP